MATKYLVMTHDKEGHKARNLKRAVTLAGGQPFIAQKILRGGKKSKLLRKYAVEGTMARCIATKEV